MTLPEFLRQPVLLLCIALGALTYLLADTSHRSIHDEVRYADYAIGLSQGVFGISLGGNYQQGYANAPLYPVMVAVHVVLSDDLRASLECVVRSTPRLDCPVFGTVCGPPALLDCATDVSALVVGQSLLFTVAMYLCFLLTLSLTGNERLAVLSVPGLFLAMHFVGFVEQVMTENLVLPLVTALLLSIVNWLKNRRIGWLVAVGVSLGLLMLTRPEYLYVVVLLVPMLLWLERRRGLRAPLVLLLCVGITVSPWIVRNQAVFGHAVLVGDSYSGIVLSERVAFNAMTASEWFGGFVYWLPDFGDELAPLLLPESAFVRYQEFRQDSFSTTAATSIYPRVLAAGGDNMTSWLIRHEVLPDLPRHALTTLPLMWRGLFIGKYWGIIGFIGLVLLLRNQLRDAPALWLGVLLVPFYLVCLRAGVSVNMPRYSVPLMPLYAMGWAYLLARLPALLPALLPGLGHDHARR